MQVQRVSKFASRLAALSLIFIMNVGPGHSQSAGTGSIAGTVVDASGSNVPDSKVIITNNETGVASVIASDKEGKYNLPSLAVGTYSVAVEKQGFQRSISKAVEVSVGRTTVINVALAVGEVSQQVEVTSTAPLIETQDNAVGMIVGHEQVQDLPLNGRSYVQMATYSPGVIQIPNNTVSGFGEGVPMRLAVNGARPEGQLFLFDGTDTKGLWGSSGGSQIAGTTLGIDAISEFQTLTSTYGAQYGGNGTVVNAAVRTGTNNLHGTLFDFERNSAMDARNYFDPLSGPPPFYRHQFGGAVGGPIRRDKLFYFVNYEGLRQNLGISNAPIQVPDSNARQGLIPCYQAVGVLSTAGTPCTATSGGNASMAKAYPAAFAAMQPILNTWPVANGAELAAPATTCSTPPCPSGAANYQVPLQEPTNEDYVVAKPDYEISAKDSVQLTYVLDKSYLLQPNYIATLGAVNNQMSNQVTITEKKIISPTKINTAHFSYYRPTVSSVPGVTTSLNAGLPSGYQGTYSIVGSIWTSLTLPGAISAHLNDWEWSDDFFWVIGKHTIQAGGGVSRYQWNLAYPGVLTGAWSFSNMENFFTSTPVTFNGPLPTTHDNIRGFRFTSIDPFIQDQFQVTRRLSLNLGVRYEFDTNPTEARDKVSVILDPASSTSFTIVPNLFAKNPTVRDVAPRLGFAWDVFGTHETSVRGGFGIFYDSYIPMYFGQNVQNAPFYAPTTISNPTYPNPFVSGTTDLGLIGYSGTAYGSPSQYHNRNPSLTQYNLNIQQKLIADTVFSIGYVGMSGRHLYLRYEDNTCAPTSIAPDGFYVRGYTAAQASAGNCNLTNPNFAAISLINPVGTSSFNSLQASWTRDFRKGIGWQASYTYSRCLSFGDTFTGGESTNIGSKGGSSGGIYPGGAVSSRGNQDYAACDFNLTSVFSGNLIYDLPLHGNRALDGWQTSLIGSSHTGFLTTPLVGVDMANCGLNACAAIVRPDVVPGCDPYAGARKISEWYNPNCFAEPALGLFGDARRNTIKGPDYNDLDFSLVKYTKITETTKLELRAEFFNVLNHTNLGFPTYSLFTTNTGTRNAVAGQIQDTGGATARQLQFAAKFSF